MNRALAIVLSALVALAPASWAAAWGWRRGCPPTDLCTPSPAACYPMADPCQAIEPLPTVEGSCEAFPCGELPCVGADDADAKEPAPPPAPEDLPSAAPETPTPPIAPPAIEDDGANVEPEPPVAAPDTTPEASFPSDPGPAAPPVDSGRYPGVDPSVAAPPFVEPESPPVVEPETEAEPESEPSAPSNELPTNVLEGLFGESAAPFSPDAESAPAESPAGSAAPFESPGPSADEPAGDEVDEEEADPILDNDLFGTSGPLADNAPQPAAPANEIRTWYDAAGEHSCEARLVKVRASEVVLLRTDGVEIRIGYRELSDRDLQYLRDRIDALRQDRSGGAADRVASRDLREGASDAGSRKVRAVSLFSHALGSDE